MKRREFLIGCAAGMALMTAPSLSLFATGNTEATDDHCLVVVFLRGGADGLQLVAPTSDAFYQNVRIDGLKVANSGYRPGFLLENGLEDVGFRLHPMAPELHEFYQEGKLAILHACGLTNGTRSHFEAMALIERGLVRNGGQQKGWITRALEELAPKGEIPALATSGGLPQSFAGFPSATSISDLSTFALSQEHDFPHLLRKWYSGDALIDQAARRTLDTLKRLAGTKVQTAPSAHYPETYHTAEMNLHFQTLAQLIKEDVGVRIAMVDVGGWDTHEDQVNHFPKLVNGLSTSLAAFYRDLAQQQKKVTILVMSEFGRRLRSNRSNGTDHGYGNMMMVLGDRVKGGRMYGKWPGLSQDALDRGVDLAITTDYRAVIGELLQQAMGVNRLDKVFPDFIQGTPIGFWA